MTETLATEEAVREWLPTINHLFPGAGITAWSIRSLSLDWWLIYAMQAKAHVTEMKKQAQEARRGK